MRIWVCCSRPRGAGKHNPKERGGEEGGVGGLRPDPPPLPSFGEADGSAPRRCADNAALGKGGVWESVRGKGRLKAAGAVN